MVKSLNDHVKHRKIFVDAMNLSAISYHGMRSFTHRGQPTGMLFGAMRLVLKYLALDHTCDIVFLWEGRDSWRKAKYPIYKAKRSVATDRIFFDCIAWLQDILPLAGVTQETYPTYEADDLAELHVSVRGDERLLLVSKDWDWWSFWQPGEVDILYGKILLDREFVVAKTKSVYGYSVPLDKLALFKVLIGDKSDCVDGIPRFPRKLAARLVLDCTHYSEFLEVLRIYSEDKWACRVVDKYDILERNDDLLMHGVHGMDVGKILRRNGMFNVDKLRHALWRYDIHQFDDQVEHISEATENAG